MEIIGNRELTYLYAGGTPFAIHEKNGEDENFYYLHLDYQGSIRAITNEQGNIVEQRDYDAWGRPRNPVTLNYTAANPFTHSLNTAIITSRGYTFHEHIFEFSLINMNARMYDPVTRRVISPDNYIQAPDNTQSFNRYSYCWNNPLKYTDPSGDLIFVPILIAAAIGGVVNVGIQSINGNINYNKSGWGWDVAAAFGIGAAAGAVSVAVPQALGTFMGYGLTTATGGIASGFIPGAIAGTSSGFVGSFGNSMYFDYNSNTSFVNNLGNAAVSGLKGAVIGGITGGLIGGVAAKISDKPFWGTKVENMPWYRQVSTTSRTGRVETDGVISEMPSGNTYDSKGNLIRTEPKNLAEQLTLKEAQSGQGKEIMKGQINDSYFQGWQKMQHTHTTPSGETITIHYWKNPLTGEIKFFKFK
jgi:RHS repeat-associated protein